MGDLTRRIGIIDVSIDLIRENPEGLLQVFKDVLVTDMKVETNGIIHYRGLSKHFDIIKEGGIIPKYDVPIRIKDDGLMEYDFVRVDSKCQI